MRRCRSTSVEAKASCVYIGTASIYPQLLAVEMLRWWDVISALMNNIMTQLLMIQQPF